jgi:hypothetical protein
MFESMKEHPDLLFSDACVQLVPVEERIESYLSSDIIEMIHKTDPRICNSAFSTFKSSLSIYFLFSISILFYCYILF